ncbi:ubiquitin carboxyl-terminal hydrolase 50 isoform X4 [Anomalospiza imberbis]|uniref:ubiquitin carboxyl-terminal hydrolase 50 isoform X4 n=1 Tax=Anomalospiza imberbis TaxID=187417 RepID=UPI00358E126C
MNERTFYSKNLKNNLFIVASGLQPMVLENSRWKDGMEMEVFSQGTAGGYEQPAPRAHGAAEPGEHVLHERSAAVPLQPDPARAVFPLRKVEHSPAGIGESATAFGCLVSDMWLGEFDYVSPEAFHSVFGKRYPAFSRRTQHDAQEFLICVLDDLHEAFKEPSQERQSPAAGASTRSSSGTSIITHLFEGQLSYGIRCLTCKALSDRPENFTVLSLPIPSTRVCSLQDCLECFFQPDTLTRNNQIHCYWCGSNQDATVKASITKAPQIIIFHLKRFAWQDKHIRKLLTTVCYPFSDLDLSPYISTLCPNNTEYSLCAVVPWTQSSNSM